MTGVRRTPTGEASDGHQHHEDVLARHCRGKHGHRDDTAGRDGLPGARRRTTAPEPRRPAAEQMRGQRLRFSVAPDGTVSMAESNDGTSREVAQVAALMPPRSEGGDQMARVGFAKCHSPSARSSAHCCRASCTSPSDSIRYAQSNGRSPMRGEVQPATGPGAAFGATLEKGFVNGTMLVDQRRGWLTESWFSIVVSSTTNGPAVSGILSMHMQMRITQHMHTLDRR